MDRAQQQLTRWRDAGLVTDEQVAAILAFERDHTSRSATPAPDIGVPRARPRDRRSVAVEAIGYVGGALAVGAVALLLAEVWRDLVPGARLALLLLVTLLLGGAGLALRGAPQPPLQRLAAVLLTGSVGGVAWSVATFATDVVAWDRRDAALVAAGSAAVVASALYLATRRTLLQLALLVSVAVTALVLLLRPVLTPEAVWFGLSFWTLGIAWLLLGRGGWLTPARTAEVSGAVVALVAVQGSAFSGHGLLLLLLGAVTAAALVALAVASEQVHHLVVGALGLFVLIPQLVFEVFGGAIGAPATLLVVGLALVLLAVGLGRAHREVRQEQEVEGR